MNKDRINQTAADQDPQPIIPRCVIEYYERLDFVERVCRTFDDSHVGTASQTTTDRCDRPEPATSVFFGRFDDKMVSFYAMTGLGRKEHRPEELRLRRVKASVRLKTTAVGAPTFLGSNLGRGSPRSPETNMSGGKPAFLTCQLLSISNNCNLLNIQGN